MSDRWDARCEVIVRFARTEEFQNSFLASRAREILGSAEREALARLRPVAARRDYLAAHALARMMLGELAGCDPARVRLRTSPRGRPEFLAPPGAPRLRFSISHADGVVLCAVAEGCEVGADVESLRNVGPDPLGVAPAVCSRRERDALHALPASARAARLLSIWTLKEALAKATGLGFYSPLVHIPVYGQDDDASAVSAHVPAAGSASLGRLFSWQLPPHHTAAVALLSAPQVPAGIRVEEGMPCVAAPCSPRPR